MTDGEEAKPEAAPYVYGDLYPAELWWRDRYNWLEEQGYRLRPRYRPDWVAPWKTQFEAFHHPDAQTPSILRVIYAVRVSDGKFVAIKKFRKYDNPFEESIHRMFGSGELAKDSRNHCIPLYDVLDVPGDPDMQLLVIPFAGVVDVPRWDTVGEAMECIRQIVEGVTFMHEHHVAHRDCKSGNIMMDPTFVFPESFHPVNHKRNVDMTGPARSRPRTQSRPRYWLIDLGVACLYPPEDGPARGRILAGMQRDVPEYQSDPDGFYDPFVVDVFLTGLWIKEVFTSRYTHLSFLQSLVDDMCATEPARRPTMPQALAQLEKVEENVSTWRLRSRPVPLYEDFWQTPGRAFNHWRRKISYFFAGAPALPRPTPPSH